MWTLSGKHPDFWSCNWYNEARRYKDVFPHRLSGFKSKRLLTTKENDRTLLKIWLTYLFIFISSFLSFFLSFILSFYHFKFRFHFSLIFYYSTIILRLFSFSHPSSFSYLLPTSSFLTTIRFFTFLFLHLLSFIFFAFLFEFPHSCLNKFGSSFFFLVFLFFIISLYIGGALMLTPNFLKGLLCLTTPLFSNDCEV